MMRAEPPLGYFEGSIPKLRRTRTRPFPAPVEIPHELALVWHEGLCVEIANGVSECELAVVRQTLLQGEWPITPHVPSALAGFRHSLNLSQARFSDAIGTARLNVERWETGKSRPYRGNLHPLLRVARHLVDSPTAAGQFFNLAAAVVLPRLTRPAGTYRRSQIRELLVNPESDNSDLTDNLLDFFVSGEILTALDPEDSSEKAGFIPRIGVQVLDREREPWLVDLIAAAEKLSDADRKLWLALADRLAERE